MGTLEYILNKFNLSYDERTKMPLEIPNYTRDDLAVLFKELGFKKGVEIGVEQGVYSEVLCKANPELKLYGVDSYKTYATYRDHTRQGKLDRFYNATLEKMKPYNYQLIKKFSMDAVKDFEDESLDFVYIDGNHDFQYATNDIVEWGKKVRKGGIISGHDYYNHRGNSRIHVYQVVNGYTYCYRIRPYFVIGLNAKVEGLKRDEARSFMWVK